MRNIEETVRFCVTPYKEFFSCFEESLFNHLQPGYTVPEKVVAYLRVDSRCLVRVPSAELKPQHSFSCQIYHDDAGYWWDALAWKYVLKYGLTLPEEFIAHVMSEEGTAYINRWIDQNPNWSDAVKKWKKEHQGYLCLMPTREEMKKLEFF